MIFNLHTCLHSIVRVHNYYKFNQKYTNSVKLFYIIIYRKTILKIMIKVIIFFKPSESKPGSC